MKPPTKNSAERKVNERRKRNLNAEAGSDEGMREYREHWKNKSARIEDLIRKGSKIEWNIEQIVSKRSC